MNISEILQTASDRIYPSELGHAKVTLDSRSIDGDTPLHIFIWGNETESAIALIQNGADVNAIGSMGETPLHVALHQNNNAVMEELLKANAKTDIISDFGKTPINLADEKGIEILKGF